MRGIGLGELAQVTRIPRRSLERLEAGEFDVNPDGFARGFVRAVSTALGLDPDEAVSRMLVEPEPEAGEPVGPSLRRAGLVLALAGSALVLGLLWGALRSGPDEDPVVDVPTVIRRDAVSELAEEARRLRPIPPVLGEGPAADPPAAPPVGDPPAAPSVVDPAAVPAVADPPGQPPAPGAPGERPRAD